MVSKNIKVWKKDIHCQKDNRNQ